MDILDGQGFYTEWFKFRETTPHSEMFEMMDIENKNFVINSGSFFIIVVGIWLWEIDKAIINTVAKVFARYKWARKIGLWAYEKSHLKLLWAACRKLFIESYFDLSMCVMLSLLSFLELGD